MTDVNSVLLFVERLLFASVVYGAWWFEDDKGGICVVGYKRLVVAAGIDGPL